VTSGWTRSIPRMAAWVAFDSDCPLQCHLPRDWIRPCWLHLHGRHNCIGWTSKNGANDDLTRDVHESGGGARVRDREREGSLIALLADWLMMERGDRSVGMSGHRHCWNGEDKSDYSNRRNSHVLGRDACVAGCAVWERPQPHDWHGTALRDEPEDHEMDEEMGHSEGRRGKNCGWNEQGHGHAGHDRNTSKMQGVLGSGQDGGREDAVGDERDEPREMGG